MILLRIIQKKFVLKTISIFWTCQLIWCKESTVDGVKSLDLNFSSTLDTFMNNVGSSAEYYVVGSICNTFLEAYNAEKIKITVEDGAFETGHAEYPGYMFKFEDQ